MTKIEAAAGEASSGHSGEAPPTEGAQSPQPAATTLAPTTSVTGIDAAVPGYKDLGGAMSELKCDRGCTKCGEYLCECACDDDGFRRGWCAGAEAAAKECERRATVSLSLDSELAELLADMHTDTAEIIRAMEPPDGT